MNEVKRIKTFGILFLVCAALAEVLVAFSYSRGVLVMEHYIGPMIFAFAGMTLLMGRCGKQPDLWVGVCFAGWYVISRILLRELYLDHSFGMFCNLCCAYLLALPFARTMDDAQKKQGLKAVAAVFCIGYGVLAWIAVLAALAGEFITLPYLGTRLGIAPDLQRLYAGAHPNIAGCLFLIALLLGAWLTAHTRRRWIILPALLLGVGLYTAIALTVSRTVMLQAGCLAAGVVVLSALRLPIKAMWKKLAIGLVAGAACLVLVFVSFGWITDGVTSLSNRMTAHAEAAVQAVVEERSLTRDLATMTGRTDIYQGVMKMIQDRPGILFTGLPNSKIVQVMREYVNNEHAHNSFLQTLVNMGLPGLLMALWFAARAVWVSLRLVFSRRAAFADQLLAVALLVLLVGTIPESYLFSEYLTAANMPFFLILGYALETERALRA